MGDWRKCRRRSRPLSESTFQVFLTGEIDFSTAGDLRASLLAVISADVPERVEIDLAGVTSLDCCGLSVPIAAQQAAALRLPPAGR